MWLLACSAAPELLVAADAGRDGLDGADGPFGATRETVRAAARVDEVVTVELVYPSDEAGGLAVDGAPAVVFVPGGFVDADRYLWLAGHLATRGYAVVLPRPPLRLAILKPGQPQVAVDALEQVSAGGALAGLYTGGPVVVAGHSLGGVVAGNWFLGDEDVDAAVLLAAWPTADAAPGEGRPLLSLVGSRDGSATPAEVADGLQGYDALSGVIDGMTHYAWTDDPSAGELGKEPAPSRPIPDLRRDAQRVIDAFVDGVAGTGEVPVPGVFPGVEWR
jgi:pimeloyl-ACP methyl ester carboxylesterase